MGLTAFNRARRELYARKAASPLPKKEDEAVESPVKEEPVKEPEVKADSTEKPAEPVEDTVKPAVKKAAKK